MIDLKVRADVLRCVGAEGEGVSMVSQASVLRAYRDTLACILSSAMAIDRRDVGLEVCDCVEKCEHCIV